MLVRFIAVFVNRGIINDGVTLDNAQRSEWKHSIRNNQHYAGICCMKNPIE